MNATDPSSQPTQPTESTKKPADETTACASGKADASATAASPYGRRVEKAVDRRARWAQNQRIALAAALGGKCAICGSRDSLTFDCIKPQGDAHHRMNAANRMTFYNRQARQGNVQLLCFTCNVRKGSSKQPDYVTSPGERFPAGVSASLNTLPELL